MAIDSKSILGKLRGEADKRQVNLYVDKSVYKQFQGLCAGVPASKVVEELIREFIQSALHPTQPLDSKELSPVRRRWVELGAALDERELKLAVDYADSLRQGASLAAPKKSKKQA